MVKMNETLLYIIGTIQDYKKYLISKNYLQKIISGKDELDWYEGTKELYNSLNNELFNKAGIKKNNYTFERIITYPLTNEINNTEFEDLKKFEF